MRLSNEKLATIRIGLMGDVMIGRLVNEKLDQIPFNYIWGDVLPLLKGNDLNLINLESALTNSSKLVPKVFNFKADPSRVQALIDGSIHVVNLANNHVLDYSQEGLLETLITLDRAEIKHVGAGRNIAEASAPVINTIKGIKIGILGCTDNEPSWLATDSKPGIKYLRVGDIAQVQSQIQELRSKVDILIMSIHWGPNMCEKPSWKFIQFAHDLVELGVDLIHGHSAHIFQAVEVYKGKLILYDTGDFVDDYAVDPILRNDYSFLFVVECSQKGIANLRLIPVLISNYQVNKARGDEAQKIMERMQFLSMERDTELDSQNGELILHI